MSVPPSINLKIDSGATHHFQKIGSTDLPQKITSNYNPAARVSVPNGASMVSSATTYHPIPSLPPYTTKSHVFNHLASGSLFSVRQACDHNCTAVFDKNSLKNIQVYRGQYYCALSTHNSRSPQCTITTSLFSVSTNSPTINTQSKCNHK